MTVICSQLFCALVIILSLCSSSVDSFLQPLCLKRNGAQFHAEIGCQKASCRRSSLSHNSVLKSILDDDEVYTDFETMNTDNELQKKMARELYDELRAGQLGLSIESFLKWEDIEDVLDSGIIDDETMEIIIDEVGVKNGILSFEQFYELVELVNQVSIALDGDEELLGKSE
jgi:DNA-directed RNA polymerase subunit N (RpoN/RPB10)